MSADFPPPMPSAHDTIAHKRIDRVEVEIGNVFSRMNELERKVSGMATDITWIRGSLDSQREDIEDIKAALSRHASESQARSKEQPTKADLIKAILTLVTIVAALVGVPMIL